MTKDGYVLTMEVNVMGPALLTKLLAPHIKRVVNVAAASYGVTT